MHALKRIFSFPVTLASFLALLGVLTVRGRFDDPDLWWHLRMGQVIWTTHSIPTRDLFSYTANHQAIVAQEWLSEVTIYGAYLAGGYSGLMLWLCALTALLLIAAYVVCWIYSGNAKVAFLGALIVWFFGTIGFAVRPQMISSLLLIAELLLIHGGRRRNPRWFLGLPILFLFWINFHAGFILGILVACSCLFASFFNFEIGWLTAQRWDAGRQRMLALSLVLSAGALFVNPGGIRQIVYPFDSMLNMPFMMASITEWAPLNLTEARGIGLMAVLLCCVVFAVTRKAELNFDELILLALGTWMAAEHTRMLIIFGVLAAPVVSRQLADSWEGYDAAKDRILPNVVMIGLAVGTMIVAFPSRQNLEQQVAAQSPVKAVAYIRANHLAGPMLNDYGYGGYLIWAMPEHPVMMDGRADVYEWSGFLNEYGKWATAETDPNLLLEKYKVSFCLLSTQSVMIHVLPLLRDWKQVYADSNSVIFVRATAAQPTTH